MPIMVTDDQGVQQEICPAACYDGLFDPENMTQEQIDAICNLFSCGPTDVDALATALYLLCFDNNDMWSGGETLPSYAVGTVTVYSSDGTASSIGAGDLIPVDILGNVYINEENNELIYVYTPSTFRQSVGCSVRKDNIQLGPKGGFRTITYNAVEWDTSNFWNPVNNSMVMPSWVTPDIVFHVFGTVGANDAPDEYNEINASLFKNTSLDRPLYHYEPFDDHEFDIVLPFSTLVTDLVPGDELRVRIQCLGSGGGDVGYGGEVFPVYFTIVVYRG